MLRVGLTGGLGSGKSTVAAIFREHAIHVLEADAIAREMMRPGQEIFHAIVQHFGTEVLRSDGTLDRARLAALAFTDNRLSELNQIVHPPVVAEQERRMRAIFAADPAAVAVVESALIFEAEAWGTVPKWPKRFDRLVLVTASDDLKIQRYLNRVLPENAGPEQRNHAEQDARARLAAQLPDAVKAEHCDYVLDNSGSMEAMRAQVARVAAELQAESAAKLLPAGRAIDRS